LVFKKYCCVHLEASRHGCRRSEKANEKVRVEGFELVAALPDTIEGRVIGGQLARAGTSVGANYRAACRSRSKAEFIAKLGLVEEEADESSYWLELVIEGSLLKPSRVEALLNESNELLRIVVRSKITARSKVNVDEDDQKRRSKTNRKSGIGNRK
jgi:four helix bundle protein